jgi:hypothetical protein
MVFYANHISTRQILREFMDAEVAALEGALGGRLYSERHGDGGGLVIWSFGWRGAGGRRS